MQNRVFIIVDGSNFYHRLKELKLKNLLSFDYEKFTKLLVGKENLISKKYNFRAKRENKVLERSERFLHWNN